MPRSAFSFSSTAPSSTRFMNWSKPRSTPLTWRLAFSLTAQRQRKRGQAAVRHAAASTVARLQQRRAPRRSHCAQHPAGPRTAELLVHHALELGRLDLRLRAGRGERRRVSERRRRQAAAAANILGAAQGAREAASRGAGPDAAGTAPAVRDGGFGGQPTAPALLPCTPGPSRRTMVSQLLCPPLQTPGHSRSASRRACSALALL